jgi:biotin-(acetyl-CoA carboxylase) ligase
MYVPDPAFPPLLSGHAVRLPLRPFREACRRAAAGALGAGDVVWARNRARAEMAVVLEPEVPLRQALQMGPVMMVAAIDCLGTLLPPHSAVVVRWPDKIVLNLGEVGRIELAAAAARKDEVPAWLVVGASLALQHADRAREPGETAHLTVLHEEGGRHLARTTVLESLAAHFLSRVNAWTDDGFRPLHDHLIGRVEGYEEPADIGEGSARVRGRALGLDEELNLLVKPEDGGPVRAFALRAASPASWERVPSP